ncbi:MAG: sigma-70 family RNA polymerase sigma factor [Acidobacteria bacterium]|nr:sigma-70 family RNA polymerase sigma factor [Acidobacteriota bacterium]
MKDANLSNLPQFDAADESQLIRRLQARDQAAMNALYERYANVVYAVAIRIVGQTAEAEDVVVDCFWQVWQQAANYDTSRGQLRTWIVTIARSRALDRLRAMRRAPVVSVEDELLRVAEAKATDNPEQETWLSQQSAQIHRALATLPREQRQALALAYYRGLSQSEIAEQLGEPLGTIKTRIRLGMMKLREQLQSLRTP